MNDGDREVAEFRRMQRAELLDSDMRMRMGIKRCEVCGCEYASNDPENPCSPTRCITCCRKAKADAGKRGE